MATWVDELYADWADYEGENRENGGGRGGWREEEKGEDEEEELATREDEQFTLGREEASSARARLQFPNRETPVPLCIVSTFRYRCFLMRHRLGLLGRNASPPSRAAWRAGVGEKWGSQILFGKHRGRGRSASPEREEGGGGTGRRCRHVEVVDLKQGRVVTTLSKASPLPIQPFLATARSLSRTATWT